MSHTVELPALGESVTEGTVTRWLVAVGDTIAVDEPLVEVSTDKVDTEVPSPVAGVVEQILVEEDEDVEVGGCSCGSCCRGPRRRCSSCCPRSTGGTGRSCSRWCSVRSGSYLACAG